MRRNTEGELLRLLDALYEGMVDDAAWQRALHAVGDFVSGSALALFSMNPSSGQVFRADVVRADERVMRDYSDIWIQQDSRHLASLTCAVGEPQIDGMLVNTRSYRRSAVFNELLSPADIPYHLATWVERTATRGVVLSVQGSHARGAFDEHDRRRMALLIPHVRRIVEMKDRLVRAETTAANFLETMNRLPFGVLLLGADLQILEASASAAALLAARVGLHADGGRLGFARSADAKAFAGRIGEQWERAELDDSVIVARLDGRGTLRLLVLPASQGHDDWLRRGARWIVLLFDTTAPLTAPEHTLRSALGVSAAEAALAIRLANGLSVAEAAADLEISPNTARAQLKSVFAKTGVRSQAQLIRLILTGPALLSPAGSRKI